MEVGSTNSLRKLTDIAAIVDLPPLDNAYAELYVYYQIVPSWSWSERTGSTALVDRYDFTQVTAPSVWGEGRIRIDVSVNRHTISPL